MPDIDVAIVGAGVAGLAAGRYLTDHHPHLKVRIFEAGGRVGGRAYTDTGFSAPVDLGATWLHYCADPHTGRSNNPLYDIALAQDEAARKAGAPAPWGVHPDRYERALMRGGARVSPGDPRATNLRNLVAELLLGVAAAGEPARLGEAADRSVEDVVSSLAHRRSYALAANAVVVANADSLADYSVLDMWRAERLGANLVLPGPSNQMIPKGVGTFVASFAAGLDIALNTPVTRISRREPPARRNMLGVTPALRAVAVLATPGGEVTARAVIVTASIGVLQARAMTFAPDLPPRYWEAIDGLKMHALERIVLEFSRSTAFYWGPPLWRKGVPGPNTIATDLDGGAGAPSLHVNLWGKPIGVCLVGGPTVERVRALGEAGMHDFAKAAFQTGVGYRGEKLEPVVRAAHSDWQGDPWIRGAYSYAPPGATPHRATLATPIEERLYFAGEATSVDKRASLAGAWETGLAQATRAADAVNAALMSGPRSPLDGA